MVNGRGHSHVERANKLTARNHSISTCCLSTVHQISRYISTKEFEEISRNRPLPASSVPQAHLPCGPDGDTWTRTHLLQKGKNKGLNMSWLKVCSTPSSSLFTVGQGIFGHCSYVKPPREDFLSRQTLVQLLMDSQILACGTVFSLVHGCENSQT